MLLNLWDFIAEMFVSPPMTGWLTLSNTSRNYPRLSLTTISGSTKITQELYFVNSISYSEERAINLLRNRSQLPQPGQLPAIVTPEGNSRERAEYLYKEIREFCLAGTENLVAPVVANWKHFISQTRNKIPSLTLYICVICLLLLPCSLSSMLPRRWRWNHKLQFYNLLWSCARCWTVKMSYMPVI